jgi:hypothetical protein
MSSDRALRLGALFVAALVLLLAALPLAGMAADSSKADPEKGKIPFPRPRSHSGNWIEYHGKTVEPAMNATGPAAAACLICHERTDCVSCHNTRPPRDHTNTWRTRSHGFMAEGNRDRCQVCPRQDFCVRCHNETAPRTHVGNWRSRHCTWCHYGSGLAPADSCVVCHKKAPHTSAPHSINPQTNCSTCHT